MTATCAAPLAERMSPDYIRAALKFDAIQAEILDEWGKGPLKDERYIESLKAHAKRLKKNYAIEFGDIERIKKQTTARFTVTRED